MNTTRRIWLTGASSGIGAELAELLLRDGHRLALSARRSGPLEALQQRFPEQVLLVPGDLTDAAQVTAMAERIARHWGALDCAILNAGTCEYLEAGQFDADLVERVVAANLLAPARCIEVALPLLRKGERPHLVGVVSAVTHFALPRAEAYGASKAGLRYLLESLRVDLAHEGLDVTLVSPGFVDTPLTQRNDFPMPLRWSTQRAARHIVQRLPRRPLEIAFPGPFILALRLLARLPARLRLALGRRLARNGAPQ
ncbi:MULTISPECIES: SDR family NAD(P)-dependent oxidoreductase [unclassified Pseudomonas]|uniref:SDR family NAD(P)-dependent oxidoreductase n=1 Tax=unclassified Pseudomonas TaxID=196821 RepID=UPI000DA9C4F5|nr:MULTISPECIES: SDR family NAD(P)-dependent oxidoreductase [unclassified Pseudomonas]MDW3714664.1 SDR family NAD(P)-dependent oxidoreductase [Pseudomonas sp. 2023EL-01195]PZE13503.1 short-chain dehydrogenase [Pseudomonas sp. 57B-090624]